MVSGGLQATTYRRAAELGVVAGMRSQLPLALLAWSARDGDAASESPPPSGWLRYPAVRRLATLAAVGELVGDKLPMTPSRLDPAPLAGRLVIGGLAGSVVAHEAGSPAAVGALLGAAGAGLGAFAGYHVRAALGRVTRVPDPVFGALEDGVAIALGLRAATGLRDDRSSPVAPRQAGLRRPRSAGQPRE